MLGHYKPLPDIRGQSCNHHLLHAVVRPLLTVHYSNEQVQPMVPWQMFCSL
jgi:hypothetical protein